MHKYESTGTVPLMKASKNVMESCFDLQYVLLIEIRFEKGCAKLNVQHLWYCNTNQEAKQFYQAAAEAASTISNSSNDSASIAPSQSGQPSEDDTESVTSSWQIEENPTWGSSLR